MFTLLRLVLLPLRVALGVGRLSTATAYRAGRLVGYRRIATLGLGVAIGLLLAPTSGAELRRRLRELVASRLGDDTDLAEQVRYELRHAPRSWHVVQPEVEVRGSTVVLSGEVPHATAKSDLEAVVRSVPGVSAVDNQLRLPPATA